MPSLRSTFGWLALQSVPTDDDDAAVRSVLASDADESYDILYVGDDDGDTSSGRASVSCGELGRHIEARYSQS